MILEFPAIARFSCSTIASSRNAVSITKVTDAKRLGADAAVLSSDKEQMRAYPPQDMLERASGPSPFTPYDVKCNRSQRLAAPVCLTLCKEVRGHPANMTIVRKIGALGVPLGGCTCPKLEFHS